MNTRESDFLHQLLQGDAWTWEILLSRPVHRVSLDRTKLRGTNSHLRRVRIRIEGDETLTLLVKRTNRREVEFYRRWARGLPLALPEVHYAEIVGEMGWCILEMLPPAKPLKHWSPQDEMDVLGDLARLHAAFWGRPPRGLPRLYDDINRRLDDATRGIRLLRQIGGWPGVLEEDTFQRAEALLEERSRLLAPLLALPDTLVHGDCWSPNWAVLKTRRVLFDWQAAASGAGVWDVVFFLEMSGGSGTPLPLAEAEAFETYLEALSTACPTAAGETKNLRSSFAAVAVLNTLASWIAYACDYLRWLENYPFVGHAWRAIPLAARQGLLDKLSWSGGEYYREVFASFNARLQSLQADPR